MENDKYRNQLLNDKLKTLYDDLVRSNEKHIPESEMKTFKVQLRIKLNAAYGFGVYSAAGKNVC